MLVQLIPAICTKVEGWGRENPQGFFSCCHSKNTEWSEVVFFSNTAVIEINLMYNVHVCVDDCIGVTSGKIVCVIATLS